METIKALEEVPEPDDRNRIFVMVDLKTGAQRPRVLMDFHRDASRAELSPKVPEYIRSNFATAQNLLVYAWFYYPFHMSAELQAYSSVEFALRERLQPKTRGEKGFRNMLNTAVRHGLITDNGFRLFPVSEGQVRHVPVGSELREVNSYAEVLVETLPALRNNLAHGTTTLHEGSPLTLRICADLINQLFETTHVLPEASKTVMLPQVEATAWLTEHIPYRVVAAISMSEIEQEWEPGALVFAPVGMKSLSFNYAALQGRRAAIRWLIEFIGVKKSRGTGRPEYSDAGVSLHPTDCGIQQLLGGERHSVDPNNETAVFLANVWQGCTQAILHPTRNTRHFDVEHANLNKAASLIVNHLQANLYDRARLKLKDIVKEYCLARTPGINA